MARGGSVEEDDRSSVHVNEDVEARIAFTGRDIGWRRDDRLRDVVDLVSTTLEALLSQLLLPNCFAAASWFPRCGVFALSYWIASNNCDLNAVSVRSACGLKAQYS